MAKILGPFDGNADNYEPNAGKELKADGSVLDVPLWRESVYARLEAIRQEINDEADTTRTTITTEGDQTQAKLDTIEASLASIELDLESIDTNITTQGDETQAKLDVIEASLTSIESTLTTESNETQSKLDIIESSLTSMEADLEAIDAKISSDGALTRTQIDAVATAVTTEGNETQAKLDTIESSLTAIQTEINDEALANRNNETAEHTSTRTQIDLVATAVTTEGNETQTKLDTIESSLTDIEADVEANTTQLTGINGKLSNDNNGNLKVTVGDRSLIDMFGRIRVSEPYTVFDSKMISDNQPLFYDEVTNGTGSATYNTGDASVSMGVSANGDYSIRQTFMRFNYQPGKSQLVLATGILGAPVANTESKIGYFNTSTTAPYTANEDGIYWGCDGATAYVARSKNGTQTKVTQANFNFDTLDGNGPSGLTIDWSLPQIFGLSFEWLGVGSVWMFLFIDAEAVPVHRFDYANETGATGVYMSSPNHSIRYEVRSTGGTKTMKHICSTVMSEGGFDPSGVTRSVDNGITPVVCGNVLEGVLFFRLNSARPCTTVEIDGISILNTTNNASNYKWAIVRNPVIAGTAPIYSNIANSAIDFAPGQGDNTLTSGQVLLSGYNAGSIASLQAPVRTILNAGVSIAGTQDVFALAIQTLSGTDSFVGAFNLREITCG